MRAWKKKCVMLAALLCTVGVGIGSVNVLAAKNGKADFSDFIGSSEDMAGGTVAPELTYEKEGDTLRLSFDTNGYQERYYTATAFKNVKLNLKESAGISFWVCNNQAAPVRMNFALFDPEGRTVDVGAGFFVKLCGETTSYAKVEYGCFELPGDFEGEVQIPFDVLAFQDTGDGVGEITQVWGYGIICVAEQGETYDVTLSNLAFLTAEETASAKEPCELTIEGDERAFRPKVGESDTSYHAVIYNMLGESSPAEAVFSLNDEYEQASVSENGVLTVGSRFPGEMIEIKAETADGLTAVREIAVYDSWTNSVSTDNGFDASLADPTEIPPIVKWADDMRSPDTLWLIRGVFAAGGIIFLAYYLAVRRENRSGR